MTELRLDIKHGTQPTFAVLLPQDSTLQQLQQAIEERTEVIIRRQKLLCKGKVLSSLPGSTSLTAAGVTDGSKLMLLTASAESQGQAALRAAQKSKAASLAVSLAARRQDREGDERRGKRPGGSSAATAAGMSNRIEVWKRTGIVALRDLKLSEVPFGVFTAGDSIRVADMGNNCLSVLPPEVSMLRALQKLRLSMNALDDTGMPWEALTSLPNLLVLALDSNKLTEIPECISRLGKLQKLSLESNALVRLPLSIGALACLRALSVRNNRIKELPTSLGNCTQLEEIDASHNPIAELPKELHRLVVLKLLLLDETKIASVPTEVLTGCVSLSTLSLHGCPVTAETLRETPGFSEFEQRRRGKYDKKVDMKVLLGEGGFDQGVDIQEWEHWND